MEHKIINCPHCGKIVPKDTLEATSIRRTVTCPECGNQRNLKDGIQHTKTGENQRYLCCDCGHRYSEQERRLILRTKHS